MAEPRFGRNDLVDGGFGRAWLALTVVFALHVLNEATTGFLNVYDPTVAALRARWAWLPMPTFSFPEWLVGLIAGVVLCFALTPFAARGARWLRPLAWFYTLIHPSERGVGPRNTDSSIDAAGDSGFLSALGHCLLQARRESGRIPTP